MKNVWEFRRDYLRVSTAMQKINREVSDHLNALYAAMNRREAIRPKHDKARNELDDALIRESRNLKKRRRAAR